MHLIRFNQYKILLQLIKLLNNLIEYVGIYVKGKSRWSAITVIKNTELKWEVLTKLNWILRSTTFISNYFEEDWSYYYLPLHIFFIIQVFIKRSKEITFFELIHRFTDSKVVIRNKKIQNICWTAELATWPTPESGTQQRVAPTQLESFLFFFVV